jgi:hypothetical protein
MGSWDNVYIIVSGLGTGQPRNPGSTRAWHGQVFCPDRFWNQAVLLPIHWVPGIKVVGREADSPPSSVVEVKNEYTYVFTPSYCFIACTETFVFDGRIVAQAVCR